MTNPSNRIGIEFICVFGMPPVEFVHLAADLGCEHIGTALAPIQDNPHNYPVWSMRDDAALRRNVIATLRERGVSISLGEGFLIRDGMNVAQYAADLNIMRELGVTRINALSIDSDLNRSIDQLAALAEMASAQNMDVTLEYMPGFAIGDLKSALAAVRLVGKDNLRLLIDAMHFVRSGSTAADLAAVDTKYIGYLQLCDAPIVSTRASYGEEARDNRLAPGKGEFPLLDILKATPPDVIVGLEVPMLDQILAGIGPRDRLAPCIETTRALLEAAQNA